MVKVLGNSYLFVENGDLFCQFTIGKAVDGAHFPFQCNIVNGYLDIIGLHPRWTWRVETVEYDK